MRASSRQDKVGDQVSGKLGSAFRSRRTLLKAPPFSEAPQAPLGGEGSWAQILGAVRPMKTCWFICVFDLPPPPPPRHSYPTSLGQQRAGMFTNKLLIRYQVFFVPRALGCGNALLQEGSPRVQYRGQGHVYSPQRITQATPDDLSVVCLCFFVFFCFFCLPVCFYPKWPDIYKSDLRSRTGLRQKERSALHRGTVRVNLELPTPSGFWSWGGALAKAGKGCARQRHLRNPKGVGLRERMGEVFP